MKAVYFDHAATTPMDNRVVETMQPYFSGIYGNANSTHQFGREANVAVEEAREKIAEIIGIEPQNIVFTSGGTESDNAIIKGVVEATGKTEIITSAIEHHAVLHTVDYLKHNGIKPVILEPNALGIITPDQVREAITDQTALVSLMHVNNEIGSINPIHEIANECHEAGVPLHSDTVQSLGKLPVDVQELGVDFLSASGHKIYGPKGIGFMYISDDAPWKSWMHGGSQERNRRGGTLNVPGIIGMAKALELCQSERAQHTEHFTKMKHKIVKGIHNQFPDLAHFNGDLENGVPHILNISFQDTEGNALDGEMLLLNLDVEGICVSNGSACTSGAIEPSHVLMGLGMSAEKAKSSIRISMGKDNTEEQVDFFLEKLEEVIERMTMKI